MNNNNFLKIFSIIAFIAFMLVSCWATVESLYMSDPIRMNSKIPYWVVTIGLYVISGIGATLIVNSLNQRIRVDNRGGQLIGGIAILLVFWLLFSMPTNTHIFFYSNKGYEGVISPDITRTKMYLQQVTNEQVDQQILKLQSDCEGKISSAFENFITEYNNTAMPGYGPEAKKRMKELNDLLASYNVTGLAEKNGNHSNPNVRRQITAQYRDEIEPKIQKAKEAIAQERRTTLGVVKNQAEKAFNTLNKVDALLHEYKAKDSIPAPKDMKKLVVEPIQNGYTVLANYPEQIRFANDYDKTLYSPKTNNKGEVEKGIDGKAKAQECESGRLFNAFSVWQDYFKGKYKGMGFLYWIMLALLVDIGGFIFFTIAFRRTE